MSGHLAADVLFEALYVRVRTEGAEGTGSAASAVGATTQDDGAAGMDLAVFVKGEDLGATGSAPLAKPEPTDQSSAVGRPRDGTIDSAQSQSLVTTTPSINPMSAWIMAYYNYRINKKVIDSNVRDKESERQVQILRTIGDPTARDAVVVQWAQQMMQANDNLEKQKEWERHVRNYAFIVTFAAVLFALHHVLTSQTFGILGETSTVASGALLDAAKTLKITTGATERTASDADEVIGVSTGIVRDLVKGVDAVARATAVAGWNTGVALYNYVSGSNMFASGEDPPETSRVEPIPPETLDALTKLVETFYPVILASVLKQEAFRHITVADRKALYAFYSP